MFDVVSCGEAAQGSLYFTAFRSKRGSHAEKCVHQLVEERTDPHLIPAQAGGGSWGTPAKGKADVSPVMVIHQLQFIFSSAVTKMARQD